MARSPRGRPAVELGFDLPEDEGYDSRHALRALFLSGENLDPAQERARLDRARRELAELDRAKKAGNLVDAASVAGFCDQAVRTAREHLLAVPGRYAALLAAETDARKIEAQLDAEIRRVLSVLAEQLSHAA